MRSGLSAAEARAEKSGKGAVTEKPESETAGRRDEAARSEDGRAPGAPQESRGDSTRVRMLRCSLSCLHTRSVRRDRLRSRSGNTVKTACDGWLLFPVGLTCIQGMQ